MYVAFLNTVQCPNTENNLFDFVASYRPNLCMHCLQKTYYLLNLNLKWFSKTSLTLVSYKNIVCIFIYYVGIVFGKIRKAQFQCRYK